MARLKAFIGHSFNEEDEDVIRTFLKHFDSLKDIGFEWEHAERAEAKELAAKVKEKIEGKNLFIGIFTKKNKQIPPSLLKPCFFNRQYVKALSNQYVWTTSDWVLQESGYALGKGLNLIFLVEKGIETIGGLQGNLEYIPFERENIPQSFTKLNEIITSLVRIEASEIHKAAKDSPVDESDKTTEPIEEPTSFAKLLTAIQTKNSVAEEAVLEEMLNEESDSEKKIEIICSYHWMRYRFGKKDILSDLQKLAEEHPKHPSPSMWLV